MGDALGPAPSPDLVWSPDSRFVYFVVSTHGNVELWRVERRTRKLEPVIEGPGAVIDFAIDFERGRIFYSWADATNPGEIRSRDLESNGSATLHSELNSPWLKSRRVAQPEEVWFNGKGDHPVQGWILEPPGINRSRKHPGLLYIHGGPAAQYGWPFFHEFQALAGRGYVVFYCNPRGGTGYTRKHLNSVVNRWGTLDYDDLMRFTDTVLRRKKHLDRKRLGVAGGSYGGFMTNWIVGHTQRFACAITQRSISNFLSFIGASDFGYAWPREFGQVQPWENPLHYLKKSPLYYLKNMRTPILIEHQEEDHRCPIDQAEQLWSALKAKGVPTEFIRYPEEPHGMSRMGRPDRRIDRIERISKWLGRWLRR